MKNCTNKPYKFLKYFDIFRINLRFDYDKSINIYNND